MWPEPVDHLAQDVLPRHKSHDAVVFHDGITSVIGFDEERRDVEAVSFERGTVRVHLGLGDSAVEVGAVVGVMRGRLEYLFVSGEECGRHIFVAEVYLARRVIERYLDPVNWVAWVANRFRFADTHTTDGIAVKPHRHQFLRTPASQISMGASLHNSENELPGRPGLLQT